MYLRVAQSLYQKSSQIDTLQNPEIFSPAAAGFCPLSGPKFLRSYFSFLIWTLKCIAKMFVKYHLLYLFQFISWVSHYIKIWGSTKSWKFKKVSPPVFCRAYTMVLPVYWVQHAQKQQKKLQKKAISNLFK